MSKMSFKNPIVLVPTIILGVGLGVGGLVYGINSLFSGSSSNPVNASPPTPPPPPPVVNSSPPASYDSPTSDGENFENGDTTNSSELPYSSGGFHKKKKRKSKSKSKSRSKPKSKSKSKSK
jgi:hypothetical protein